MKKDQKKCSSRERECFIRKVKGKRGEEIGLKFILTCSACERILKTVYLKGNFESPLDGRYHGNCPICGQPINNHKLYELRKKQFI